MRLDHTKTPAQKRKARVRGKLHGTAKRPRLSVFRSNKHMYLQVIDDDAAKTLVAANDLQKAVKTKKGDTKTDIAGGVAQHLAENLTKKKIKQVVFDRGSYRYHGRVKKVAETLREKGILV